LLDEGHSVRAVDCKPLDQWWQRWPVENVVADLREGDNCCAACRGIDYAYQLAADMGGAGYVFSGDHDADIMRNSGLINFHTAYNAQRCRVKRILYASSACIYPKTNQTDPGNPNLAEHTAYPAFPDSEYGWEKLCSERLYLNFARNYGLGVRIARLHNVYGPHGSWNDGREKAPAAICRKVAEALVSDRHEVNVWGDGSFTRSFMWVDDCVEGLVRIMRSDTQEVLNLGSEEMVTINQLVDTVASIAGIDVRKVHDLSKPQGVAGRNSDNRLIRKTLGWETTTPLRSGLGTTFAWILEQLTSK
jgi:nucleoside-diphosphate-sugar epimerase